MRRFFLAFLVVMTMVAPVAAQNLNGEAIRDFIAGEQVYLATPYGVEFPLFYAADGSVTGDGSGTGLGKFFAPRETGEWWVEGANLCQQFPTWYDGKATCFTIEQTGENTLAWVRDDGMEGTARIAR